MIQCLPPGRPTPVVGELLAMLDQQVPELGLVARVYFANRGGYSRTTYGGNDAAADLMLYLVEALGCLHQVRMEVLDQAYRHGESGLAQPIWVGSMLPMLLESEAHLVRAGEYAVRMHSALWDDVRFGQVADVPEDPAG